jgi:phosphoribosylanthranilate isomerase
VAVTTEARPERLRALVRVLDPDVLQLHTPQYPEALRAAGDLGVPVWGMMSIGPGTVGPPSLEGIEALVLDSPGPRAGGNGRPHDWARSREVREALAPFPVVLAGGLGPENAALAIRTVRPYALDVSSGVSGEGGKDPEKVRELIAVMRGALE